MIFAGSGINEGIGTLDGEIIVGAGAELYNILFFGRSDIEIADSKVDVAGVGCIDIDVGQLRVGADDFNVLDARGDFDGTGEVGCELINAVGIDGEGIIFPCVVCDLDSIAGSNGSGDVACQLKSIVTSSKS